MAIAFVAATKAGGDMFSSYTATLAGVGANDVQFALLNESYTGAGARVVPGWTQITTAQETTTNYAQQVTLYWRRGPGDFTPTASGTRGYWSVGIVAYSGLVTTGTPYQSALIQTRTSTAPSAAVTTASTAVRLYTSSSGSTSVTPSITPNTTARLTGSGPAPLLVVASSDDPVSPTTAATRTWLGNSSAGMYPMAATVVLNPYTNTAPNAPTLNSPANNATIDRAIVQRFAWTFSDPDAGDSQSKFDLQYRIVGAPSWTAVTGTTPNTFWDAPASTFAAGNYEWQVRTYDTSGDVGPWSASSYFTAQDQVSVVGTASGYNAAAGTISNLTLPAGIQAGDVIVVRLTHTQSLTGWQATGYTEIPDSVYTSGCLASVLTKVADGTEGGTSPTFSTVTATSVGRCSAVAVVLRGSAAGAPVNAPYAAVTPASSSWPAPAASVNAGDIHLVFAGGQMSSAGSQPTWTTPSGYSSAVTADNTNTGGSNSSTFGCAHVYTAGTAVPSETATSSDTGLGAVHSVVVALNPPVTGSAATSGSGTLSATGAPAGTATAALAGGGTLASSGAPSVSTSIPLSGVGTLSSVGSPRSSASTALSGAGALAATGALTASASVGLAGSGSLVATSDSSFVGSADLSGSGSLNAAASHPAVVTVVALSGGGTLSTVAEPDETVAVDLSGSGALSVVGIVPVHGTADLSSRGSLTAAASPALIAAAPLDGQGSLGAFGKASIRHKIFIPPTVDEGPAGGGVLFRRYRLPRGETVIKYDNGTYAIVRYPSSDVRAGENGVAVVYLGGYEYFIDDDEASALTAAGYGDHIEVRWL